MVLFQLSWEDFADGLLFAIDEDVPLRLGREQSDPFLYLCDLLSGFLLQHSYQSHFFVLSSNISAKVATLLYAREKHLRLCKSSRFLCLVWCTTNVHHGLWPDSGAALLPDMFAPQQ